MVTRPDALLQYRRHRHRRRIWTLLSWALALVLSAALVIGASLRSLSGNRETATLPPLHAYHGCALGAPKAPSGRQATLIVLSDGQAQSRLYGVLAANLVSHFGGSQVITAADYQPGMAAGYQAVVYVGVSAGTPVPPDFLNDVLHSGRQVMWLGENIDRLAAYMGGFQSTFGWTPGPDKQRKIQQIDYRGAALRRDPADTDPLTTINSVTSAKVLGTMVTTSGQRLPWAVRSGRLTYVAETPLDAATGNDRYLAISDMLYDLLAPQTTTRHRALVRLEDIGPEADPKAVKAAGELLYKKHVPFSFGVFPVYIGPAKERPRRVIKMRQRPELVQVISYLLTHGGTMVLHGYTHQSSLPANPDNGESGQEFEFFQTHFDSHKNTVYDGALPGDSAAFVTKRIDAAAAELHAAHLPMPRMFEFPHYAGSRIDYQTVATRFAARYDHGQYFEPDWNGRSPASPYMYEQFAPYLIRDVYGSTVVPENLGFVQRVPDPADTETVGTIVANARAELAVRDNIAGFFYHPFLGTKPLAQTVDQIEAMGYHFVSPCDL